MADPLTGMLFHGASTALSMGLNASDRKGNNSLLLAQVKIYVDHITRRLSTLDRHVEASDDNSDHREKYDFLRARFDAAVDTFERARKGHEKSNFIMKLAKAEDVHKMLLMSRQEFAMLTSEIEELVSRVRPNDRRARPPPPHHLQAVSVPRPPPQRTTTAPPPASTAPFNPSPFGYPGTPPLGFGSVAMPMPMPMAFPSPTSSTGSLPRPPPANPAFTPHGYPPPQPQPHQGGGGYPPMPLDHSMGAMHLGAPPSGAGAGYKPSGMPAQQTPDMAKLITVAIDFGTSHTGFAFADRSMTDAELNKESLLGFIHQPQNWPDAPSPYAKTRSAIAYRENGAVYAWGNTAEAQMAAGAKEIGFYIHRVKLLLDENRAKNDKLNELLEEMQKTPVEVIADYLRELLLVIARDTEHMMGG
ncbi:hypothetical protein BC828DRAFT_409633, partial [Blastocladiella britannica]